MASVTFITTVLNEEKAIKQLLDSVQNQTRQPDQIIIVDAGSHDKTRAIIRDHQLDIDLIINKGCNRSQGRNLAINKATHPIIAVSDAGCRLKSDWLANITQPLSSPKINAVAGFYHLDTSTPKQQAIAPFVATMPEQFDRQQFLPSSRSLAFKKSSALSLGGYPEDLDYCEDLVFAQNLKDNTYMKVVPQALVYWQPPVNFRILFNKVKNYAYGDIKANYWPHVYSIITTYIRYLLFFLWHDLFYLYLLWPIFKFFRYAPNILSLVYLPIAQVTVDIAILTGSLSAFWQKSKTR